MRKEAVCRTSELFGLPQHFGVFFIHPIHPQGEVWEWLKYVGTPREWRCRFCSRTLRHQEPSWYGSIFSETELYMLSRPSCPYSRSNFTHACLFHLCFHVNLKEEQISLGTGQIFVVVYHFLSLPYFQNHGRGFVCFPLGTNAQSCKSIHTYSPFFTCCNILPTNCHAF